MLWLYTFIYRGYQGIACHGYLVLTLYSQTSLIPRIFPDLREFHISEP